MSGARAAPGRKRPPGLSSLVEVGKSAIDGRGIFARRRIGARRKIGELQGELISQREARRRARALKRIAIVELDDGTAIDASVGGNELAYINHSCSGNVRMKVFWARVAFYARRDIRKGEELTCDYGESHHEGRLRCRCGSPECRKRL